MRFLRSLHSGLTTTTLNLQSRPRPARRSRATLYMELSQALFEAAVAKEVDGAQGGGVREAVGELGAEV